MGIATPSQGSRRWPADLRFWIVLSVFLFAVSAFCSHFGLFGQFRTTTFGVSYSAIWDPGGPYLASGTLLYRTDKASFYGHPGLFLQTGAALLGEGSYLIATRIFDCSASYPRFIAKNCYWFILVGKLIMTACHLLWLYLLSRICARFWTDRLTTHVAILACLTTFPVLYYLNTISPEPILITWVLTALLLAWKWADDRQAGRSRRAWAWFALSALACAGACCSKFMFGVPATVAVSLYYVIESKTALSRMRRVLLPPVFLILCALLVIALSQKVDWRAFFVHWRHYTAGLSDHPAWSPHPAADEGLVAKATAVLRSAATILRPTLSLSHWLPARSPHGLLCAAEIAFVPVALVGTFLMLRRLEENRREFWSILLVVICIAPIVIYKDYYNYYILPLALASIPFAYVLTTAFRSVLKTRVSRTLQWAILAAAVGVIHLPSIIIIADAKLGDIQMYRWYHQCYFTGLRRISYDQRIGLTEANLDMAKVLGFDYRTDPVILKEAIRSFFYAIPPGMPYDRLPDDVVFVVERRTLTPVPDRPTHAPVEGDGS